MGGRVKLGKVGLMRVKISRFMTRKCNPKFKVELTRAKMSRFLTQKCGPSVTQVYSSLLYLNDQPQKSRQYATERDSG